MGKKKVVKRKKYVRLPWTKLTEALFCYVRPETRKHLDKLTKAKKVSNSELVDRLIARA